MSKKRTSENKILQSMIDNGFKVKHMIQALTDDEYVQLAEYTPEEVKVALAMAWVMKEKQNDYQKV